MWNYKYGTKLWGFHCISITSCLFKGSLRYFNYFDLIQDIKGPAKGFEINELIVEHAEYCNHKFGCENKLGNEMKVQVPPNNFFALENALRQKTEYFIKFLFVFESTIVPINNEK